jgi:hypothetical protein
VSFRAPPQFADGEDIEHNEKITNKASTYAAKSFIRHMRHSLMTAKDIEGENIANDDFRTNPIYHRESFMGQSVGSTSRPSPALRIFDNDNGNRSSDQAQVDEEDYGYSISPSRYSVSKDEDDDLTSFYEPRRGDEDSFAEADQEPASSDEFVAVRVPEAY